MDHTYANLKLPSVNSFLYGKELQIQRHGLNIGLATSPPNALGTIQLLGVVPLC